jgi:hypothetical protein
LPSLALLRTVGWLTWPLLLCVYGARLAKIGGRCGRDLTSESYHQALANFLANRMPTKDGTMLEKTQDRVNIWVRACGTMTWKSGQKWKLGPLERFLPLAYPPWHRPFVGCRGPRLARQTHDLAGDEAIDGDVQGAFDSHIAFWLAPSRPFPADSRSLSRMRWTPSERLGPTGGQ